MDTPKFASLDNYEKGHVEIIDDDPTHYAFSNIYEVASHSAPYEKVAVAVNRQYVLEAIRAEGTSEWRIGNHDESAIVMDGSVEIHLLDPEDSWIVSPEQGGSMALRGEPKGKKMGVIRARKGHMALLPAYTAYQFRADAPAVLLLQTIKGPDTVFKWQEIIQTQP
jgi:hypothetical protein